MTFLNSCLLGGAFGLLLGGDGIAAAVMAGAVTIAEAVRRTNNGKERGTNVQR